MVVVFDICLNKVSIIPIPIKTRTGYIQKLFLASVSFCHGIEKIMARNAIVIPAIFNADCFSSKIRNADRTGINNDNLWAISVLTIPVYLIDKARTTNKVGSRIPKITYTGNIPSLIEGISGL